MQLAHDILAGTKSNPPEPHNTYDQGYTASFWDDAIGNAYSYDVFQAHCGTTPLRLTLLLCKRIRENIVLAKRIWPLHFGQDVDQWITMTQTFENDGNEALAKGKISLDDVIQPDARIINILTRRIILIDI